MLVETARTMVPNNEQDTLVSLTKFVDQLPSVFNEVLTFVLINLVPSNFIACGATTPKRCFKDDH